MKIFSSILIATHSRITIKKTHDNYLKNIQHLQIVIIRWDLLDDFQWFSMAFPGKMPFFQVNIKFNDFHSKI